MAGVLSHGSLRGFAHLGLLATSCIILPQESGLNCE
jgi:hypothetical protein